MNMAQALDKADRAKADLDEALIDLKSTGIVKYISAGSSGELGGEQHGNVGIHFGVGRREIDRYLLPIKRASWSIRDPDVRLIFFPET